MAKPSLPPSLFLKDKDKAEFQLELKSKDQYRKLKELEEARKAGTAPAETDEEGRDINPHIPQYISQAPWYYNTISSTLKHQRPHVDKIQEKASVQELDHVFHSKGILESKKITKFRKGACENCGSMTHKKIECFERPRKIGAKYTNDDIAPDEYIPPSLNVNYDAKRDRWAGYDPDEQKAVIEEFEKLEEARKLIKAKEIDERKSTEDGSGEQPPAEQKQDQPNDDDEGDEDKYAEDADMPGVKVDSDSRTRITVRNLRIREDTAKYLFNLDLNSAYYDPKSRSMRENPFQSTGDTRNESLFAGENFKQFTGEVTDVNKAQLFAWEAQRRGIDVHTLAEPTKLEILKNEFVTRKDDLRKTVNDDILNKYGGEEHLKVPPKELLLAQTEHYVEYNRQGKIVKGHEKTAIKSRYEEDVYHGNHTAVWGSFWTDGNWGYKCCRSIIKNSYCIGAAGWDNSNNDDDCVATTATASKNVTSVKKINPVPDGAAKKRSRKSESDSSSSDSSSSDEKSESDVSIDSEEERKKVKDRREAADRNERKRQKNREKRARAKANKGKRKRHNSSESESESNDEEDDNSKLQRALKKQAKEEEELKKYDGKDERSMPYNIKYVAKSVTEHELEAFKIRRIHQDDPMAKYMNSKR